MKPARHGKDKPHVVRGMYTTLMRRRGRNYAVPVYVQCLWFCVNKCLNFAF